MPIGSIVGGFIGSGGAREAGNAAGAAGGQAYQRAWDIAGANKALASPYLTAGYAGTNALVRALGLGHLNPMNTDGGTRSGAYGETSLNTSDVAGDRTNALSDFRASPGYQFRLDQGTKALDRSAAARGSVLSGGQRQAVTEYGQNVASDEWNNYLKNLFGLSGQGAGVASSTNAANTGALNQGNALNFQGELGQASSYSNAANALANGITNAGRSIMSLGSFGLSGGFGGWGDSPQKISRAQV